MYVKVYMYTFAFDSWSNANIVIYLEIVNNIICVFERV